MSGIFSAMKALILSDIHSNIVALEAIWAREYDADVVYCAGDLVDYGTHPREVLEWLRSREIVCVQGNHDWHVAKTWHQPDLRQLPDGETLWRHHNARLLSADEAGFLADLPQAVTFELDGLSYGMTHLFRDYDLLLSRHAYRAFCAERFPGQRFDRLILGHTHRQMLVMLGEREIWLNPGSVSYRRQDDPDQHAHYAVIVDGRVELRSLPYDCAAVYNEVERQRLAENEMRVARWFFGPRDAQP